MEVFSKFGIVNWNIGGAKYLELKAKDSPNLGGRESRDEFREKLNEEIWYLLQRHKPAIMTMQEVVAYSAGGDESEAEHVVKTPDGYHYFPLWLIDTKRHSHQGKWNKVRRLGEWPRDAYFAQGNAILVDKRVPWVHIFGLPPLGVPATEFPSSGLVEAVKLESGLYFGDRNSEPRAALVAHLALNELQDDGNRGAVKLSKPLDIFVINLHLTTLIMEREGVPAIDEEAVQIRLRQLDIVLGGIVSRYNRWRREGYPVRDLDPAKAAAARQVTKDDRHPPLWIIAGDFNFTPESVEYTTLVRNGFIDLIPPSDRPSNRMGTKASGLGNRPTLTVDYVFAGPRFEAIDPRVAEEGIRPNHVEFNEKTRISDHFPLIIDVPIALEW